NPALRIAIVVRSSSFLRQKKAAQYPLEASRPNRVPARCPFRRSFRALCLELRARRVIIAFMSLDVVQQPLHDRQIDERQLQADQSGGKQRDTTLAEHPPAQR